MTEPDEQSDRNAAGPVEAPEVPDGPVVAPHPCFVDGWWEHAARQPAHPGRVGGAICPFAIVVHTTDMVPSTWSALIRSWTTRAADGSCAHFLIGRTPEDGVVQLVPIDRNANHAGGPGHGVFVTGSQTWHPNLVAVGIELHCAGGVRRINGQWRLVEGGQPTGEALPDEDVVQTNADRGVHRVTDYQLERLEALLGDLEGAIGAAPAGLMARSTGEIVPTWGRLSGRVVGHVTLDPAHRSDPWPAVCAWLAKR